MNKRKFVIAIDFDGTIVENTYPTIGNIKQDVVEVIKTLIFKDNCEIIKHKLYKTINNSY